MSKHMKLVAITVEPEFDAVLERADAIAKARNSSRSAVLREILYNHFGVEAPKTLSRSSVNRLSKRQVEQW